ncbi:AraC family transcriptional regulator with amidase-like domain [Streptomyces sp. SLBN-118]|uniref:GlxA family transcriptional regulator n=1 Tax=Streptomyces sp. SLBN-118 TaxID=2768454 RepID=UPI0011508DC1|nr:helix-turn-helix domain-containing protein [Streptomyces sp. SLBN-118]TQK45154.1 AraC family transcriptional regulator with amidase-like domain [Streptomyces sp. SLBN-118]
MTAPRRVVIAAFPGVELLDVTGPAEVFSIASRLLGPDKPGYRVEVAAAAAGELGTSGGIRLVADVALEAVGDGVDTLLVAGAMDLSAGRVEPVVDLVVADWLTRAAPGARRVAGLCAGAHLLAAAGILDGLPATTHWLTAEQLAADHPSVAVDPDPIFVRAGRVWTCAGVTAVLDLALAMVAEDHGQALALDTARAMVMYLKRPGGQSQFSVPLSLQAPADDRVDGLRLWIQEHLAEDLPVQVLADRLHLSVRHFSRLFRRRTGRTPSDYLEAVRLEAARRLLEESDRSLPGIAADTGLGSVETLHRVFRNRLGTTPAEYRRRFRSPDATAPRTA